MSEKIQTLHPDPKKKGVNIDSKKYEVIKSSLLSVLEQNGPMTFMKLAAEVAASNPDFDGSVMWYSETVKLDLEARGIIKHDRDSKPALMYLN